MVGTLDFQVKTLVFETWLGQCVVFLGKALYSHCASLSSPPPPPRSMNAYQCELSEKANKILVGWVGWVGKGRE